MDNKKFSRRLSKLRNEKGISARDMSLSLGQSESYINKIENNSILPSMAMFFVICEYLEVEAKDFFDIELENPRIYYELSTMIKQLNTKQMQTIKDIINEFYNK